MNLTIKEIAKKAGVGIATVSRVLNNHPNVKKETREKISAIIKEHHFKPNISARRLVRGAYSETTIGIALPDITHQFFFEIIKEIYLKLKEHNYNLLIFNLGQKRELVFKHISEENLAGLFILGDPALSNEEKKHLILHATKYIYLDHHSPEENCICFDNIYGGILAAQYLIANNCKNAAIIGGLTNTQHQSERFSAFEEELIKNHITVKHKEFITHNEDESYKCTNKLLKKSKVDGIFYFSDILAFGGLRAKNQLKSDTKIIGYDDIETSKYMGLSTIHQDSKKMASTAVESLINIIKNRSVKELIQHKIKPELINRNS